MNNKKRFLLLILIALIFNLIWEFSHYSLYIDLSGISPVPHLILASFTDMLIITGIFTIASIKNKSIAWINKPKKFDYFLIIILGLAVAIILEAVNLKLGRWQYTEAMPTIFGIGLSPLLQLATTSIIGLFIVKRIK